MKNQCSRIVTDLSQTEIRKAVMNIYPRMNPDLLSALVFRADRTAGIWQNVSQTVQIRYATHGVYDLHILEVEEN